MNASLCARERMTKKMRAFLSVEVEDGQGNVHDVHDAVVVNVEAWSRCQEVHDDVRNVSDVNKSVIAREATLIILLPPRVFHRRKRSIDSTLSSVV
jgi:hypothetical protein